MNIDVGKAIKELLYEHASVVVPGLGGFIASPNPSTVDYVQGVVMPPSKKLEFNPNLVINDGVLVNHIQKAKTVTFQESGDAVARYVEEVKQALERREIVEITQVGRLYKDYEHKIRFMSEGENFNADSFGLPAVQFTPLVRERAGAAAATATPVAVAPPPPVAKTAAPPPIVPPDPQAQTPSPVTVTAQEPGPALVQRLLPWLVLLAAILLAASVYVMFGGKKEESEPLAKERINVKPKTESDLAATTEPAETATEKPADKTPEKTETPATQPATPPAPKQQAPPARSETPAPPAGTQQTFIIVHSFGVRNNATKFAAKLSESGYAPETRTAGKLYRVGILLQHKAEAEVEAMKNELGRKFDAKPKTEKELNEQEGR